MTDDLTKLQAEVARLTEALADTEHRLELKMLDLVAVCKQKTQLEHELAQLQDKMGKSDDA